MNILELNDHELNLYDQAGTLIRSEPAAAAFKDDTLIFGEPALALSRVSPQTFNNRYLGHAAAQPLPSPIGPAHNFADLVYQHLRTYELQNKDLTILAPAYFTNEQLGLMLGICQELEINVRGFIDLGLAQMLSEAPGSSFTLIDLEWHRMTATHFSAQSGKLTVSGNRVWEGRGYNHYVEGWMGVIADEFIHRTRFDPLHTGDTEQQLFDQTAAWLQEGLATRIVVASNGDERELEIEMQRLADKTRQRLEGLDLDPNQPLLLSDRVARVPGLEPRLSELHGNVSRANSAESIRVHLPTLCAELPADKITRLSTSTTRASPTQPTTVQSHASLATHLLDKDNVAHPMQAFGDAVQVSLKPGDSIDLAGETYQAVRVL